MPNNRQIQGNNNSSIKKRANSPSDPVSSQKKRFNNPNHSKDGLEDKNNSSLSKKTTGGDKFTTPTKLLKPVSNNSDYLKYDFE